MVNELPTQTLPLFTVTTGRAFTVTVLTVAAELAQPAALVPVTEYELVTAGVTTAAPLL